MWIGLRTLRRCLSRDHPMEECHVTCVLKRRKELGNAGTVSALNKPGFLFEGLVWVRGKMQFCWSMIYRGDGFGGRLKSKVSG